MNPVLMLCYNTTETQLEWTKRSIASILAQDRPIDLTVINNGSTWPDSRPWLDSLGIMVEHHESNTSPIKHANRYVARMFSSGAEYVLGVPDDATFPPNLYSELLSFDYGFVSAGMACANAQPPPQKAKMLHNDCHFAVMLTRKRAHDAIVSAFGSFFDEDYFHYASDCDMKQRWRKLGILGCQTDIQCYHYGSASWRLATPEASLAIHAQADRDRATYFLKWGERL